MTKYSNFFDDKTPKVRASLKKDGDGFDVATVVNKSTNTVEWSAGQLTHDQVHEIRVILGCKKANYTRWNEIYRMIRKGVSVRGIAKVKRGQEGYSLRSVTAVSSAINKILTKKA